MLYNKRDEDCRYSSKLRPIFSSTQQPRIFTAELITKHLQFSRHFPSTTGTIKMITGTDQLAADYKQLKQAIAHYPAITISKDTGQSPDYYEIEYSLKGFAHNPDGSIATAEIHKVGIKLPFGYPHFPPTVKPLTHIFHPDIDPAAIRIANHWQKNPNLTELVITIGKMICGDIYSDEDPFNRDAADWYKQHKEQLPLDELKSADAPSGEQQNKHDEEPADEEDFLSLDLDDDDFIEVEEETEEKSYEEQINLLKLQIEEKNIFAANGIMGDIPQSVQFSGREEMSITIGKALRQSDKLFKQAEELESHGHHDDAAAIIEKLKKTVADAPGLDRLQNRITRSHPAANNLEVEQSEKKIKFPGSKKKKPTVAIKSIAAVIVLFLIVSAAVGAIVYMGDKDILSQSIKDIEKVNQLVKKRQFFDAQAEAETILRSLTKITILNSGADDIAARVNTLLASEEFIQGLQGKILHNGEFVSIDKAEKLKALEAITSQAVLLIQQGRITKALSYYQNALAYANRHDLILQANQLQQTIHNLNFTATMLQAEEAERAKEWSSAAETYRRALELSRDISDPAEAAKISKLLTAATFRHGIDQSKQKFTAQQWQETITTLEQVQSLIEQNPAAVKPQERRELNKLLLHSRLHQILTHAREAYEKRDWQQANSYYSNALKFIETHQNNLGKDIEESAVKISRTMLMIKISMENEFAELAEQKNDHNATGKHYNNILKLIKSSRFKEEDKLVAINENIQKRRIAIQKKISLENRISWLKNNFEKIFNKHYPAFAGSKLANPKAEFTKAVGTKEVFTLSCSEGRSSRLELQYAYDRQTGKWSLYRGQ